MTSYDPRQGKQPENNNGLLMAVCVALAVMLGFEYFMPKPEQTPVQQEQQVEKSVDSSLPGSPELVSKVADAVAVETPSNVVERVAVMNNVINGGVALTGGRIDELELSQYSVELGGEDRVGMFASSGKRVHFFDAGWQGVNVAVPNGNTHWNTEGETLTPSEPLVLTWENGQGQSFKRTFSLAEDSYTIHITDEIVNNATRNVQLGHYAQIHKADGLEQGGEGYEAEQSTFYNFIGPEAKIDGLKYEYDYDDIKSENGMKHEGQNGWLGVKSRYFLAAIIPDQGVDHVWRFKHSTPAGRDFFSVIVQSPELFNVAAGETLTKEYRVYVGPNKRTLMETEGVDLEDSVDYGWYHAIALPIYSMIMYFNDLTGNLGVAIILATLVLKVLLVPLANKSYRSMARMKKITPQIEALKERCGDNREQFGLEMMKVYKENRVNPASGCWPMLLQIPIFFALYKVILISFEFRHAPFIGWINDLSAMDPWFVLPVLMGASMWFQQKLNPPATDPVQRQVMQMLPLIFTVMFAWFPAGLVLYWVVNNVLSIAQQWIITRRIEAQEK